MKEKIKVTAFITILFFMLFLSGCTQSYNVGFDTDEGSMVETISVSEGNFVIEPERSLKEGHDFLGWYTDNNFTVPYDFSKPVSNNFTLYAKWEINQYTISFEENGGSGVEDITLDYLKDIDSPAIQREGYIFDGWYTDNDFAVTYDFSKQVSSNFTLYAKWDMNQYTINIEELEVSSEMLSIFSNYYIFGYKELKNVIAIEYYDADIGVSAYTHKSLAILDYDYNILWKLEVYRSFWDIKDIHDDLLLVRYCFGVRNCTTGIFEQDGTEILSVNDLTSIYIHSLKQRKIYPIHTSDGSYFALRKPYRYDLPIVDKYELIKFDINSVEVLYEFESIFGIDAYAIQDKAFLFSYHILDTRTYRFVHVNDKGEEIYSVIEDDSFEVDVIEDGYFLTQDSLLERRDINGNVLWTQYVEDFVSVISENDGEVIFQDRNTIYTADSEGIIDTEIYVRPTSSSNTLYLFENGDKLFFECIIEDEDVSLLDLNISRKLHYIDNSGVSLWNVIYQEINGLIIKDEMIYLDASNTYEELIVEIDLNGNIIDEYSLPGELYGVTDRNTFIMSRAVSAVEGFRGPITVIEVTKTNEEIWNTDNLNPVGDIISIDDDLYLISHPQTYDYVENWASMSPFHILVVDSKGNVIKDLQEQYSSSAHFAHDEDYIYLSATPYTEDYPDYRQSLLLKMDYEGNIVEEIKIVMFLGNQIWTLQGDKIVILTNVDLFSLEN